MSSPSDNQPAPSLLDRVIDLFLRTDLAPLLIAVALIAGLFAIVLTPREEEPQIVVPMADVIVSSPGMAVGAVERQIATAGRGLDEHRREILCWKVSKRR